ncbi:hypothetical protein KC726_04345 [Candidatus Woesebacteria bacterium]|nr:hypothetical protein [Candidatus Woesebacteria bacterium]
MASRDSDNFQNDDREETLHVPFSLYLKIIVIVAITTFGVNILSERGSSFFTRQNEATTSAYVATYAAELQKEVLQGLSDSGIYETAQQSADSASSYVMGEATKVAKDVQSEATQTVVDAAYDNTLGAMIRGLILSLPKDQQHKFIQSVCQEYL